MIQAKCAPNSGLETYLRTHPKVALNGACDSPLEFTQGSWNRRVRVGEPTGLFGLTELMDNNPMVCADELSVPDAASTLALIALGPLFRAGLLVEAPSLLYNFRDFDPEIVEAFLAGEGWAHGATFALAEENLDSVLALRAICLVQTASELGDEIDEQYDECYGRSFFVRNEENSEWHVNLVRGLPHAAYKLGISPGSPHSLLTVQVMADRDGKCGASQIVHAMNVMAGFEECLGIA
ncbi:MAG: hypothetical protein ABL949_03840 [Fimbriimonadaceae bacterium]